MATEPSHVAIPRRGVDYRGKVVLAPMVRSGELPSRLLALKYGADLVWGPETIDKSMIGTTRHVCEETNTVFWSRMSSNGYKDPVSHPLIKESVLYRIHPELEGKKLIFQMGTASPETAVKAATLVAADVAGIDVNSGCPKPFSTSGGMGAALLKDPDRLCSILEALVKEVGQKFEIGISVKIRILQTMEETEVLVRRLVKTGITGLTVHCRTTPMRPRERAIRDQLRMVADVCREAGVACVMNGDVENRKQALELMKEFNVDGAMIATAAEKNSSVFRAEADGGTAPWREVVRPYVEYAMAVHNRWGNTKFLLAQLIPGKEDKHLGIQQSRSHEEVVRKLGYDDLLEQAKDVDEKLGINNRDEIRLAKRAIARDYAKEQAKRKKLESTEILEKDAVDVDRLNDSAPPIAASVVNLA